MSLSLILFFQSFPLWRWWGRGPVPSPEAGLDQRETKRWSREAPVKTTQAGTSQTKRPVDWPGLQSCLSRIEPFTLGRRSLVPFPPIGLRGSAYNKALPVVLLARFLSSERRLLELGPGVPRSLPGGTPGPRAAIGWP